MAISKKSNEGDTEKPKRKSRFEGFVHQKIDVHLERALGLLKKRWDATQDEAVRRAIMDAATREALLAETSELPKRTGKAKRERGGQSNAARERLEEAESKNKALESEVYHTPAAS